MLTLENYYGIVSALRILFNERSQTAKFLDKDFGPRLQSKVTLQKVVSSKKMRNERYAPREIGMTWQAGMSQRVFDTRVLPLFGGGLLMAAVTAYIGIGLPLGLCFAAMFGELILVLTSGMWARNENAGLNIGLFFLVTALAGIASVPLMRWALGMGGPALIMQAFAVSGLTFGGLMGYTLVSKRDFTGMGGFLMAGIIGLLIAGVVNIFLHSSALAFGFSVISVLIFAGFVLYDMSIIRRHFSDADYIMAAIMLFIDFMGLFKNILYLMGIASKD